MSADQDRHSRAGKRSSRWDPATYEPEEENPYTLMARRVWRGSFDWIVVIAVALLVGTQIKAHVVESYRIPSESMEPTLIKEDRVIVNKLTYNVTDFHRGDVVVFTTPPAGDPRIKNYIKRIIGLPGDVLESKNGLLYINGKIAKEPYLPANVNTVTLTDQQSLPKIEVPNGTLWVMGDNREHSGDSREFGPIAKDTVVGQAVLRYQLFSPGRFGLL